MKMIKIERTVGADTRSAKEPVSKETLLRESHLHRSHVRKMLGSVAAELIEKGEQHDRTKIDLIGLFHDNFVKAFSKQIEFKSHPWWKAHLKERHHINDYMHEDADLLDLIEMIADCVCAGMARTGSVFPIKLDDAKLQAMLQNTVTKLIAAIEVKNAVEGKNAGWAYGLANCAGCQDLTNDYWFVDGSPYCDRCSGLSEPIAAKKGRANE